MNKHDTTQAVQKIADPKKGKLVMQGRRGILDTLSTIAILSMGGFIVYGGFYVIESMDNLVHKSTASLIRSGITIETATGEMCGNNGIKIAIEPQALEFFKRSPSTVKEVIGQKLKDYENKCKALDAKQSTIKNKTPGAG
ncbi:MAG: hypothetical protein U9N14_07970 [Pseudomonadota bacterium]|nr:hypothetical protein [Pseudomonadota bacterium]